MKTTPTIIGLIVFTIAMNLIIAATLVAGKYTFLLNAVALYMIIREVKCQSSTT